MSEQAAKALQEALDIGPQTIEIDCPPGSPRPGDLIEGVLEGTGLPMRETVGRLFGNWMWDYNDIDPETWRKAQAIIKPRLVALYHAGTVRYASW